MRKFYIHSISLLICSVTPALIFVTCFLLLGLFTGSIFEIIPSIPEMLALVLFIAACHACILGLPLYLAIKSYFKFTYLISAVSGFLIGAIPLAIFSWPLRYAHPGSFSSYNGVKHMIDGVPTMAAWLSYIQGFLAFGLLGLAGALVFKYCLSRLENPNKSSKKDLVNGASS